MEEGLMMANKAEIIEELKPYFNTKLQEIIEAEIDKRLTLRQADNDGKIADQTDEIAELKTSIDQREIEIDELQCQIDHLTSKIKTLEGRQLHSEKKIDDQEEEHVKLKAHSMRDNLIFHNLPEYHDPQNENCIDHIYQFLKLEMLVSDDNMQSVGIDRAHRLGKLKAGSIRPIVVKLTSTNAKHVIFKHGKNLKGKPYNVSEQLPQEMTNKYRAAKQANQKPKWVQDKLVVGDKTYKKETDRTTYAYSVPVHVPMDSIISGDIVTIHNSSFQAHIAPITNKEEVIPTLHQLFSNHAVAKASHNMYAYRLGENDTCVENSCDDREYGAGIKLLDLLRNNKINNQIVIVTRWYGGSHLGPKRFEAILNAAKQLIG